MLYNTFSPFCARLRASARVRTYEGWAGPGQLRSALFSTMSMVENSASAGGRRPALRAAGPRAHTRGSAGGPASQTLARSLLHCPSPLGREPFLTARIA